MRRDLLRVAVFTAVTVALTAYLAATIVGFDPAARRFALTATFDDVSGLGEGDPVKLAGVAVGEVSAVSVERGRAEVRFSVDDGVAVPTDSTVAVRWLNLIGQRYLSIEPGTAEAVLHDGDAVERAGDVVDLGRLVDQLAPLARSISPDHVNRILEALLVAFDGNDEVFDRLLADLHSVVATFADREAVVDGLVRDYETVAGALADRDRQIQTMVDNLVAISATFADNQALLDDALVELARFTDGLDRFLDRSADQLDGTLEHLAALVGTAGDNVSRLEAALNRLPEVFAETLPAVDRGEWLRVNVLCLTVLPGPCPYPTSLGHLGGGGR